MLRFLRLKKLNLVVMGVALLFAAMLPTTLHAQSADDVCSGIQIASGSTGCTEEEGGRVNGVIATVVNILSAVVGVVAVIMILIGGFRYVISGGDSSSTASAKNTIIYAIVGLIIVALAQIIVRFVLARATGTADPTP
ncbi:MAG TPA: pilin [Verrucomicrobiae bacterium]|nr:pilin [Verrucomicrobiae bacterium]